MMRKGLNVTKSQVTKYQLVFNQNLGLCLCIILNNTFGEAKQYVSEAQTYCFRILTDFHILAASKFGIWRKMLYLCTRKQEVASTSEGCGSA